MICPKCGKDNGEGVLRCKYCDTEFKDECAVDKSTQAEARSRIVKTATVATILLAVVALLIIVFFAVQSAQFTKGGDPSSVSFSRGEGLSQIPSNLVLYLGKMNSGNAAIDAGQYGEAIDEYNEAITIDPDKGDAYIGLANAYKLSGQRDKAIEVLQQAHERLKTEDVKKRLDQMKKE